MAIELPTQTTVSVEHVTNTEPEPEPTFPERVEAYEDYWLYYNAMIYTGKALFVSDANKSDTDRSPLARDYEFFKAKKNELGQEISGLPGTFKEYAEQFEEPDSEIREITHDDFREIGVDEDDLPRYPVLIPAGYELPPVWDEEAPADDAPEKACLTDDEMREVFASVKGVGDKSVENLMAEFERRGFGITVR